MGREIRRVPVDFDWPLDTRWEGFLNPHHLPTCPTCGGAGRTSAPRWVEAIIHLLMMLGQDRPDQPLHPWLQTIELAPGQRPSPDVVDFTTGLAGRHPSFLGHDSIDKRSAYQKIVAAAGLDPDTWGQCSTCHGEGHTATSEQLHAYETWEEIEPPAGDGWQLWETVSEGSPISPVFTTKEEFARWLCSPANSWGISQSMPSIEQAMRFIDAGWAPTMASTPQLGLISGELFVAATYDEKDADQ